jgi:Flp pilus assembly protein TadD
MPRVDQGMVCRLDKRMHVKRHLSYAQGYLELGLVDEAAAELAHIAAPESDSPEVLTMRMAVLHEQEDWPKLANLAAVAVQRSSSDAGAWVTWAYATRRAHSLAAAETILLKAERQHPTDATIQFNLGCYACLRGDLAAARRRVDRAIALEPKFLHAVATDPDLAALRAAGPKSANSPGI